MSVFDAGALQFKLQTIGAQLFKRDQADAEKAIEKTGKAAGTAKGQIDALGKSTDDASKKSKAAKAPLDEQAKSTKKVGDESDEAAKKQNKQKHSTEEQAAAAKDLSRTLLLTGAAVGALVTLSVAKYAEFDQAMSNTAAATMATAAEQKALGDAALEAGADTAYSASEAAAAEEELAKAGQEVSDIVGGSLNASLALAAAGQLQVARSAEIMATAMTQFKIPAEQAGHVADVLAAGAGKAQGSVDELALALSYVGPLANQAGWSLDETSGSLAYFASQGILGEKAGTSLRGVLAALQAPSTVASKVMEQYGLTIYDTNGNMLSAAQIAGNLQTAFGGLTAEERNAAMGRIFGNESLVAANLLYAGGSEAVSDWTDKVSDSGYAAEQAAMRQDNLAGDIEKLGGALDTALIKTGSGANDVLREMVQSVTALVDMFGEAPAPVQVTTLAVGAAATAMLVFSGGAVGARAKFIELKATLDATNASMGKTALVGAGAGLALTGIIAVVGMLAAKQAEARARVDSYADSLDDMTNSITENTRELANADLANRSQVLWWEDSSIYDTADALGVSLSTVKEAALGSTDAIAEMNRQLEASREGVPRNTDALESFDDSAQRLRDGVSRVNGEIESSIDLNEQKQRSDNAATETAETTTDAYLEQADAVNDLADELSTLIDAINEANGVNQDAISSNNDYQDTLREVEGQIAKIKAGADGYAASLDATTVAGNENLDMLTKQARDSQDAAAATLAVDGSTKDYIERLKEGREKLIENAKAMNATQEEAEALADQIYKIPSEKEIEILADTASAEQRIEALRQKLGSIPSFRRVTLETVTIGNRTIDNGYADGAVVSYNADGNIYRSEHHVAQIARAGEMRVWAEPETGGETYVPHALSKRGRSEQIMVETARIFGGTYIPAGARQFADGSPVVGQTSGSPGVPEVRVIVQSKGGIDLLRYIDVKVEQGTQQVSDAVRGA